MTIPVPGMKTPDFIKAFATDQFSKKGSASFIDHPNATQQLELFQQLLSPSALTDNETPACTSNLVEIYDLIPKAVAYGSISDTPSTNEKTITIDGRSVIVVLSPAAITKTVKGKKVTRFYYPTNREDLVGDVVRYIVLRNQKFSFDQTQNEYQHHVTIHEIYTVLKDLDASLSHSQIRTSLEIMHKANLEVISMDRSEKVSGTLLPTFVSKEKGRGKGRKTKEEAMMLLSFHPLYTMGILNSNYRPYDYVLFSKIKNSVAKYIFKKMSMYYRNAGRDKASGLDNIFLIDVAEAITNSVVVSGKSLSEDKKKVVKALEELKKLEIITKHTAHDRVGAAKRIMKSEFSMTSGAKFTASMIESNKIQNHRLGNRTLMLIHKDRNK